MNSFFGSGSGSANTVGIGNSFFGRNAGIGNSSGSENTIIGASSDVGALNLFNATAVGSRAFVSQSNSLVLGSIAGVNGATTDTKVGIGTSAPTNLLTIGPPEATSTTGKVGIFDAAGFNIVLRETTNNVEGFLGINSSSGLLLGTATSTALQLRTNGSIRLSVAPTGEVAVTTLGSAGGTTLCRNASNQISSCSSSLRYKTNIAGFSSGLSFIRQLRPISFDWKDGGMKDVGFGAEDIAKIDPRFVTYNDKGEVEGVKYDRLTTVLVNAVSEQQAEISEQRAVSGEQQKTIESQQREIDRLKAELKALKQLVCAANPSAGVCAKDD